ncbi:hypothetical protein Smp_168290 [Schistosoma mansoni]|uniref:GCP_N_terminal domain-containing protein n=1 Tax=Schistosoma mansoni TaxID=6183 RepID=G4V5D2_SCHMA|nr:hypothetical protein Smp_168290 [Schistosoma mansoni]|eukprot:XP_018647493.1 hypothetical protein Smp_168290 [Schistosoma mansoni]
MVLEGQINPAFIELERCGGFGHHVDPISNRKSTSSLSFFQTLTISRLDLWTQDPRSRLRFLAGLCDVCCGLKDRASASEVFAHTLHADLEVMLIIRYLLSTIFSSLLYIII